MLILVTLIRFTSHFMLLTLIPVHLLREPKTHEDLPQALEEIALERKMASVFDVTMGTSCLVPWYERQDHGIREIIEAC